MTDLPSSRPGGSLAIRHYILRRNHLLLDGFLSYLPVAESSPARARRRASGSSSLASHSSYACLSMMTLGFFDSTPVNPLLFSGAIVELRIMPSAVSRPLSKSIFMPAVFDSSSCFRRSLTSSLISMISPATAAGSYESQLAIHSIVCASLMNTFSHGKTAGTSLLLAASHNIELKLSMYSILFRLVAFVRAILSSRTCSGVMLRTSAMILSVAELLFGSGFTISFSMVRSVASESIGDGDALFHM